ncbi:DUF2332 domain-containing protein [Umezawaea sp.]|uniref:DUF2332 domain-containing protein n=1 Tax=Umezawaea sp. TaxID=1955258 RepID=UPI002ED08485
MLAQLFTDAAKSCEGSSPLTESLLLSAAADHGAGGVTTRVMAGHECDRRGTVPGLRFAAALHRLVLEGRAPGLAEHYPTVGGSPRLETLWEAALPVLHEHTDELRARIGATVVQTNEPGRSAPLFGGLQVAAHAAALAAGRSTPFAVRLLEIGASAGLNLHPDRIAYRLGADEVVGDRDSPFELDARWTGRPAVDLSRPLRIVEREGCDLNPIDVSTEDGRLALSSFVWADQLDRWERLQTALALAAVAPAPVRRTTGPQWLADRLADSAPDVLTVVWHSVVWQYVSSADRAEGRAILADAVARATPGAPLALLVFEPRRTHTGYEFHLLLKTWPAGVSLRLGSGSGHGIPFTWDQQAWD